MHAQFKHTRRHPVLDRFRRDLQPRCHFGDCQVLFHVRALFTAVPNGIPPSYWSRMIFPLSLGEVTQPFS